MRSTSQQFQTGQHVTSMDLVRRVCTRNRVPAARSVRVMTNLVPLRTKRAQGKPGARCTRGLVCKMHKRCAHEHTGSAEAIRPSLRNGFTAYSALSSVTGLSCHRRRRDTSRQLDASVGASGPHGFAVRVACVRLSQALASTASHRNVRDDREPPLIRMRRAELCP